MHCKCEKAVAAEVLGSRMTKVKRHTGEGGNRFVTYVPLVVVIVNYITSIVRH
jgi:hypothetical protein